MAGIAGDASKADTDKQALVDSADVLPQGTYGVIAEIDEDWKTPIDTSMAAVGGRVHRRSKSAVDADKWSDYNSVLYPYDYSPKIASKS